MIRVECPACRRDITMADVIRHYRERHGDVPENIPNPVLVTALQSAYESIAELGKKART